MKEVFTEVESGPGARTGVWAQRLAWRETFPRLKGKDRKLQGREDPAVEAGSVGPAWRVLPCPCHTPSLLFQQQWWPPPDS